MAAPASSWEDDPSQEQQPAPVQELALQPGELVFVPPPMPTRRQRQPRPSKAATPRRTVPAVQDGASGASSSSAFIKSARGIAASFAGIVFALSIRVFIAFAVAEAEQGPSRYLNLWIGLEVGTVACLIVALVLTNARASWLRGGAQRQRMAALTACGMYAACAVMQGKMTYDYGVASWGPGASPAADKFFPVFFLGGAVCSAVALAATAYSTAPLLRAGVGGSQHAYSRVADHDQESLVDVPLLGIGEIEEIE